MKLHWKIRNASRKTKYLAPNVADAAQAQSCNACSALWGHRGIVDRVLGFAGIPTAAGRLVYRRCGLLLYRGRLLNDLTDIVRSSEADRWVPVLEPTLSAWLSVDEGIVSL
jgi:hypothetical protein